MSEDRLIDLCLQGDEKAWETLFKRYRNYVYRHCFQIVKNEKSAEDLTQETFVHAFQHLNTFRREARFSTWLWRIAHNLSLNYLKKQKVVEQEFLEERLPSSMLVKKEESDDRLVNCLPLLSKKQRQIMEMLLIQGLSQKEIAAKLNVPYGTIRSRIYYARKRIREILLTA